MNKISTAVLLGALTLPALFAAQQSEPPQHSTAPAEPSKPKKVKKVRKHKRQKTTTPTTATHPKP